MALFTLYAIFFLLRTLDASSPDTLASANELARKIINNEANAESADQSHWIFRLETRKSGKDEVKVVVETSSADLELTIAVNGNHLTARDEQEQEKRLEEKIHHPSQLREQQKDKAEDIQRTERLLKMLPDAFNFTYGEHRGDVQQLKFTPNPNFHPPSREGRVFHEMEGEMWVDTKQERLIEISGHLMHDVKFGGGLLGHLDQGGEFHVKQAEVAPRYWELTLLHVNMHGKALFFKSINVQQDEIREDYRRVPDNLTVAQGMDILNREAASIH